MSWTPLHEAAKKGYVDEITKLVLDQKANINQVGRNNCTPLILAADNNKPDAVERLLELGARPDIESVLGQTALSWARNGKFSKVVALLVSDLWRPLSQARNVFFALGNHACCVGVAKKKKKIN